MGGLEGGGEGGGGLGGGEGGGGEGGGEGGGGEGGGLGGGDGGGDGGGEGGGGEGGGEGGGGAGRSMGSKTNPVSPAEQSTLPPAAASIWFSRVKIIARMAATSAGSRCSPVMMMPYVRMVVLSASVQLSHVASAQL